jgi:hypothetical protein
MPTAGLGASEDRVGSEENRDEIIASWVELHNEELHNLYISLSIIRIMKPRRMKWAVHLAQWGKRLIYIEYW